ncbi:hypothetical protein [Nocardia sp. NPDC024068]|uniref:hypothetical protein n=1 Tax=Nocardia sp. NPDC024068 TaxID=3157197 RepID=UPI0034008FBA
MTGEGEGRKRESERADFGPPTGDFGPPVSEFGPPTGELPVQGWNPEGSENRELTWRPAGSSAPAPPEAPPVPPPPPQYRAPDSSVPVHRPAPTSSGSPVSPDAATVRHQYPSDPAVRQPERAPDPDQTTVRHRTAEPGWSTPGRASGPGTDSATGAARPKPGGLSWDSDPIAQKLTPQSVAGALAPKPRRKLPLNKIITIAAVVVAFLAVGVAIVVVASGGDEPTAGPPGPVDVLSCPASQDGAVTVGDGIGDTGSGPGAILGFQNAFYSERNGVAAREFVASDSPSISSAETIQQAIDAQIPRDTRHCVRITERAPDTFDVDLTERRPGGTTTVYKQTVTTVERDGKTLLWVIADRR